MRCAKCGGIIRFNESCRDCGISYSEMLECIRHPEIRRLFKKLRDLDRHHKRSDVDESLLACELLNSSLILAAKIEDDYFDPVYIQDNRKNNYLALSTDMEEFMNFKEKGFDPLIISWNDVFKFIEKDEGVVINFFDEKCCLNEFFLNQYFGDKLNIS